LALSGARSTQADLVSHVIIRMAEGDLDLADALTEVRDALAHPEGDTGDQTWAGIAEIASNVDAAVDAIRAEVENPTAPDNKQTMALVSLAEAMCDELLEALGVDDPDDDDTDTGADDATQGAMMESSGRSKSPKAVTCPTCQGRGTILKGARACPMCKGDKKVLPITAAKHFMKGSSRSGDDTETDEEREARETAEWNAAVVDHERTLALADADDILMLIDG
jgi:hypothetical protein